MQDRKNNDSPLSLISVKVNYVTDHLIGSIDLSSVFIYLDFCLTNSVTLSIPVVLHGRNVVRAWNWKKN